MRGAVTSILSFYFIFSYSLLSAQTDLCEDTSKELQYLQAKFLRLNLDDVKLRTDSLSLLVPKTCIKAKMLENIIYGRYHAAKGVYEIADQFYQKALDNAESIKRVAVQKHIFSLRATIASDKEDYDQSIFFNEKAFDLPCHPDSMQCLKQNIRLRINAAVYLSDFNQVEKALTYLNEADSLMTVYNFTDSIYRVVIFNSMANIQDEELNNAEAAHTSYKNALRYSPYGHNVKYSLFNNLGNSFKKLNQIDSAKTYYYKTINSDQLPKLKVTPFQGLGDIAKENKEYIEAIRNYEIAVKNAELSSKSESIKISHALLGQAYYLNGQYSKANSSFNQVRSHIGNRGIMNMDEMKIFKNMHLSEIALTNPQWSRKFYIFFEQYDSLNSVKRAITLNNSVATYEKRILKDSLANAKVIEQNQSLELKNQNYRNLASLFFLISSLLFTLLIYSKLRKIRKEKEELVFELEELKEINAELSEKNLSFLKDNDKSIEEEIKVISLDKTYNLRVNNIKYIISEDNGSRIFTNQESLWTDESTKSLESRVPAHLFVRIYRSAIVNISHIKWINHKTLMMKDKKELKIGRTYKQNIIQAFKTP